MREPNFSCYYDYESNNYGVNALRFGDPAGNSFYFSYRTLVAFSAGNGLVCRQNNWGNTTGKHLNAIQPDKKKRVSDEEFDRLYAEAFGKAE
ncbi:MAG: hypothetical protein ACYS30_19705 [Planctomycetota bacterium]|jgi:hypothetical protein